MSQNPAIVDLNTPICLLLENRPYTLSPDGNTRTFCFRSDEIVSILRQAEHGIKNEIVVFEELDNIREKFLVRLPGVVSGVLENWHLNFDTIKEDLDNGWTLCRKRARISISGEGWEEWLDSLQVPMLNPDYIKKRLCEEHAFNLKVQMVPTEPRIGMVISDSDRTQYIRVQSKLKKDVDVDLSDSQIIYLLGLTSSVGPSSELAVWLKRSLSQILVPELLNLGRYKFSRFETRLKNTIMQLDSLLHQKEEMAESLKLSGAGLSLGIYMPDAKLLISFALGDAAVALFDAKGSVARHTTCPQVSDPDEQVRVQRNGYSVDSEKQVISGTEIGVGRALGLYDYKSTVTKEYSRAYGAISAMPEVAIQRLTDGESVWLLNARASELSKAKLETMGSQLSNDTSSQKLCRDLCTEHQLSDAMLSRLDVGSIVRN